MPGCYNLLKVSVKQGQKQGPDMRAVNIRIGHNDYPVIAEFSDIERLAHARTERDDQIFYFLVTKHLVQPCPLDIENFATQRENRLKLPVPPLLGRPSGGIPLDNIQLGISRVSLRTIRQFPRQS